MNTRTGKHVMVPVCVPLLIGKPHGAVAIDCVGCMAGCGNPTRDGLETEITFRRGRRASVAFLNRACHPSGQEDRGYNPPRFML